MSESSLLALERFFTGLVVYILSFFVSGESKVRAA